SQGAHRDDVTIPLLVWYAIEPLPALEESPLRSIDLLKSAKIPLVREFLARKIASLPGRNHADQNIDLLLGEMYALPDAEMHRDVLAGIQAAVQGRRNITAPSCWTVASKTFA